MVGLILGGVSKKATHAPTRKLFKKIKQLLIWLGILGLAYLFCREQEITFLAAPFWLIIWLVGLIYWTIRIARYQLTEARKRAEEIKHFAEKQKYLKS